MRLPVLAKGVTQTCLCVCLGDITTEGSEFESVVLGRADLRPLG
jgi:hypothetical protein